LASLNLPSEITIKRINASTEGLILFIVKGSNLFAPHDAASLMRLGSEGLDHKLYYLHPSQTIGKEFADCTWEASSGAENIAKRPSLRFSRHSNGLTRTRMDAGTLLPK
jgi:hypothetical protein